jgi:hypothetical protein
MRRSIAVTAAVIALPAVAEARAPLSVSRGRVAIVHYERHTSPGPATVGRCWKPSRSYVDCEITERSEPGDPDDWAFVFVARAHGGATRISVWAPILGGPRYSERR